MTLELPPGIPDQARLVELLNDRFRRIAEEFAAPWKATEDIDAGGYRIKNVGDARAQADALNLQMADRRYLALAQVDQVVRQAITNSSTTIIRGGGTGAAANLIILSVPGTLSIRSNAAPLIMLDAARTVASVTALLKLAPLSADLELALLAGAAELATLTITAGQTSATVTPAGKTIPANEQITLDITGTGTTFPGADLTVLVKLS